MFAWQLTACGNNGSDSSNGGSAAGGQGGTGKGGGGGASSAGGGASGSSGAGAGGTDNAAVLRGALSVNILASPECALEAGYYDFPQVPNGHPVTATEKVQSLTDGMVAGGTEVTSVTCEWLGFSPPYTIGGGLSQGPAGSMQYAGFQAKSVPTMGGFSLGKSDWEHDHGGQCDFQLIEIDETTRSVWGEFTCDEITAVEAPEPKPCSVGPSYFYFENCIVP
jgi:hypothetical protein